MARPDRKTPTHGLVVAAGLFLVVVILFSAACTPGAGDAPGDSDWVFLYPTDPSLPRAALAEELRLDGYTEDFSLVNNVVVGPGGEMAVVLRQDRQVWVYGPDGSRRFRFGGPGEGPGEFESIGSAGWVGDTLWVTDGRNLRITFVAPSGTLHRIRSREEIKVVPAPGAPQVQLPLYFPLALAADGTMLVTGRYRASDGSRFSGNVITRVGTGGEGHIAIVPPSNEDPRWYIDVDGFGWPMPFTMMPALAVSADGARVATLFSEAAAEGGTLTLSLLEASGDTVFTRTYPFQGDPVSSSARDSALAALVPTGPVLEGPQDAGVRRQAIARERMPTVHPPVKALHLGVDGTIWLELREAEGRHDALVLASDGRPLGTVALPPRAVIRHASRELLWLTEPDEVGLADVVRYRLSGIP